MCVCSPHSLDLSGGCYKLLLTACARKRKGGMCNHHPCFSPSLSQFYRSSSILGNTTVCITPAVDDVVSVHTLCTQVAVGCFLLLFFISTTHQPFSLFPPFLFRRTEGTKELLLLLASSSHRMRERESLRDVVFYWSNRDESIFYSTLYPFPPARTHARLLLLTKCLFPFSLKAFFYLLMKAETKSE